MLPAGFFNQCVIYLYARGPISSFKIAAAAFIPELQIETMEEDAKTDDFLLYLRSTRLKYWLKTWLIKEKMPQNSLTSPTVLLQSYQNGLFWPKNDSIENATKFVYFANCLVTELPERSILAKKCEHLALFPKELGYFWPQSLNTLHNNGRRREDG